MTDSKKYPNLMTVRQISEEYPAFSAGALRSYVFNSDFNGLKDIGAIKRIGKRVLIDIHLFFEWIEKKTQEAR